MKAFEAKGEFEGRLSKMPICPLEATQEYAQRCIVCLVGLVSVGNIPRFDVFASVKSALYLLS